MGGVGTISARMRSRSDTAVNWMDVNPVLERGEIGVELVADGAAKIKVGDGTHAWSELPYSTGLDAAQMFVDEDPTGVSAAPAGTRAVLRDGLGAWDNVDGTASGWVAVQSVTALAGRVYRNGESYTLPRHSLARMGTNGKIYSTNNLWDITYDQSVFVVDEDIEPNATGVVFPLTGMHEVLFDALPEIGSGCYFSDYNGVATPNPPDGNVVHLGTVVSQPVAAGVSLSVPYPTGTVYKATVLCRPPSHVTMPTLIYSRGLSLEPLRIVGGLRNLERPDYGHYQAYFDGANNPGFRTNAYMKIDGRVDTVNDRVKSTGDGVTADGMLMIAPDVDTAIVVTGGTAALRVYDNLNAPFTQTAQLLATGVASLVGLGIGTTAPGTQLEVAKSEGGAVGPDIKLRNTAGQASDAGAITFATGDSTNGQESRARLAFAVADGGRGVVQIFTKTGPASWSTTPDLSVTNSVITSAGSVGIGGTSGPTWTCGTGVPSASAPNGSLYSRIDGGAGSTLYVRENGSWLAK